MVLKKIKLPGAPTTSNILVEESGGGGVMYVTQVSYENYFVTFNKTAKEIIDAFESGVDVRVKLNSETDPYSIDTGEYSLLGYYHIPHGHDVYTIIFIFENAVSLDSGSVYEWYGSANENSPLLYYIGD